MNPLQLPKERAESLEPAALESHLRAHGFRHGVVTVELVADSRFSAPVVQLGLLGTFLGLLRR
jgi:hypothetical protein